MTEKKFIFHADRALQPERLEQKLSKPAPEAIRKKMNTMQKKRPRRLSLSWRHMAKRLLNRFPFLWRPARWVYNHLFINRIIFTLRSQQDVLFSSVSQLERKMDVLQEALHRAEQTFQQQKMDALEKRLHQQQRRLDEQALAIQTLETREALPAGKHAESVPVVPTETLKKAVMDRFYLHFENRFRGSESAIAAYQQAYLGFIPEVARHKPVLDIGCGRGEWLRLLLEQGYKAEGIDLTHTMAAHCLEKGLPVRQGDGLAHLDQVEAGHYAAITAFHIVEHIPFADVVAFFEAAYRALDEQGVLIVETPNPENLQVGAHTFWMDPTHLKPIPPALLAFAAEYVGFARTHIERFHPYEKTLSENAEIREIQTYLFKEQDYALIAWKQDHE